MISFNQRGDFDKTEKFLKKTIKKTYYKNVEKYARYGVDALSKATPIESGKTAESWDYEIHHSIGKLEIVWTNSNMAEGTETPVAILLQYGHGTKNGKYVQGIDYINPALKSVFDKLAEDVWKEVTEA